MKLTIEQAFQQGVIAHKEGRLQEAERLYKTILQTRPTHAEANYNLGMLAVSVNKVGAALTCFKAAVEANPNVQQFWLTYLKALIKEQKFENAKSVLKQAKKHKVAADKLKVFETALAAVNKGNDFDGSRPPHEKINNLLEHFNKASFDEAEKLALAIIEDFPRYQLAWKVLGAVFDLTERKTEALDAQYKAVELSPLDSDAYNNLGITLKGLGRLAEAEESYKKAIEIKPSLAEAHSNLGATLRGLGRLDEAEQSYRKALALKPEFAEAHTNLGNIYLDLGRVGEAEKSYRAAIASDPNYASAHSMLGSTLQELGRFDEAVDSRQKAFKLRTGIVPMGDAKLAPATSSLFFELTNKCNFHCTFCPSDFQTRKIGSMDFELVKRLYAEAANKKIGSVVNLHLMGEPTLHPKLVEILKFGASKNIKTDLVTNGSTLVPKVVPKILESMYGTITVSHMTPTVDTYHFRGEVRLSWDRYISNIRLLVREYMKLIAEGAPLSSDISIRVMVTQNTASNVDILENSNEVSSILQEWNDFVAKVEQELGMVPFKRVDHRNPDLARGNKYSSTSYPLQRGINLVFWRAFTFANTCVGDDFDLEKKAGATSYCSKPFTDVGVLWNGDVTLCGLDHDGQLKVGNVRNSSIENVIQSEDAQKLRASMLGKYPLPSICQKCQERPVRRVKTE